MTVTPLRMEDLEKTRAHKIINIQNGGQNVTNVAQLELMNF